MEKKIKMFKTDFSGISIDTPEDLIRSRRIPKKTMKRSLARVIFFKLMGWTIKGEYPDIPKLIVAVVPHSSYFDFIVAVLTRTILNKRIKFLGKKELFNPFTGLIFKFWGGIPIDREINKNYVETVVELINNNKINHLSIAPEGTRKKLINGWKSKIPIMMTSFDYCDFK